MEYYLMSDGRKCGPFSHEELRGKSVTPDMQVWHEGMTDWIPARNIPEKSDVLQPELAPLSNNYYAGRQRNGIDNWQEERVPPMPNDYKSPICFS